jgi:hypothetical protein
MIRNSCGARQTRRRGAAARLAAGSGPGPAVNRLAGEDLQNEPAHRRNP